MHRFLFIMLLLTLPVHLIAQDDAKEKEPPAAPPARAIDIEGNKAGFPTTRANAPTHITDAKQLADAFPDKAMQQRLAKLVDFEKESLLYFAWAGSGQDQLTVADEKNKDGEIVFNYKMGRTRDLRQHFRLFAIAKNDKWKVAQKI